jgi:hypothetical protein
MQLEALELLELVRGTKVESSQAQSIMDVANHECGVWRIIQRPRIWSIATAMASAQAARAAPPKPTAPIP